MLGKHILIMKEQMAEIIYTMLIFGGALSVLGFMVRELCSLIYEEYFERNNMLVKCTQCKKKIQKILAYKIERNDKLVDACFECYKKEPIKTSHLLFY